MKKVLLSLCLISAVHAIENVQEQKMKKLQELSITLKCNPGEYTLLVINKDKPTLKDLLQTVAQNTGKSLADLQLAYEGTIISTRENRKKDILLKDLGIVPGAKNKVACVFSETTAQ